jgi:hypothetical protein
MNGACVNPAVKAARRAVGDWQTSGPDKQGHDNQRVELYWRLAGR